MFTLSFYSGIDSMYRVRSSNLSMKEYLINDEYHMTYSEIGKGWPENKILKRITKRIKRYGTSRKRLLMLLQLQKGICFHCNEPCSVLTSNIDHVMPLASGGSNRYDNLVASHVICNTLKGGRLPTKDELDRLRILHKDHLCSKQ